MSSFFSNSPFAASKPELSTKTKNTDFYLPGLYLNEEEVQEENKRFSEFLDNTIEAREYTKNSTLDDVDKLQLQTYYERKEEFFKSATKASTNKVNEVLAGWRLDREDEPLLSITVAGPEFTLFQPKKLANSDWQFVDEFTFAGGSTFGALLDEEASTPQFTELSGRNAQSNYYAAIRARGGKQGELWSKAIENSVWLKDMLTETDSVKQALDGWIESSPTAFSVKASVPLSAYFGDTILDILADSPKPEGWSTEQAIKELKESDPGLAAFIFGDMQVKEERLKKLAQTPLQFKYFIADAIDTFAYQSFLSEYTKKAGFWEEAYSVYAWPLVRDSINSNDSLSDVMTTAGAVVLTGTGVGAYVGIPILVGKGTEKILTVLRGSQRTYDVIESVARRSGQIARINQAIWKTQRFLPSRLTDTVLDNWGVTKRLFDVPEGAGALRRMGTYVGKQFTGESAQGLLESGVQQYEGMSNGFQEEFSVKDLLYNGVEEGIGGILLGGPVKALSVGSERLMTTRLGDRINAVIDAGRTILSTSVQVSPQVSNTLDTAVRLMMGIPEGQSIQDFEGAFEQRLRLRNALIRIEAATGIKGILDPDDDENELLTAAINALSGGDPNKEFAARVEILKRITTLMDRFLEPGTNGENTSTDNVEALLFLTAMEAAGDNEIEIARINEALWLYRKRKDNVTEKDGRPLSIRDATDEELQQIALEMQDKTNVLASRLGAENADQVSKIFGSSLSEEDIELTNEVIEEYENEQVNSGSTERETIEFGVTTDGVIRNEVDPARKKEESVDLEANTTIVGLLKENDEVEFVYSSGTRGGTKRRIRVINVTTDSNGKQTIKAFDLDKNEERNYLTNRIKGKITFYKSTETETPSLETQSTTPPQQTPQQQQTPSQQTASGISQFFEGIDSGISAAAAVKNAEDLNKVLQNQLTIDELIIDQGLNPNKQTAKDLKAVYNLAKQKGLTSITADLYISLLAESKGQTAQTQVAPSEPQVAPTQPTKPPESSVSSIVDGLFDNKEIDESIELTEEEKADLVNRVCYRKDI